MFASARRAVLLLCVACGGSPSVTRIVDGRTVHGEPVTEATVAQWFDTSLREAAAPRTRGRPSQVDGRRAFDAAIVRGELEQADQVGKRAGLSERERRIRRFLLRGDVSGHDLATELEQPRVGDPLYTSARARLAEEGLLAREALTEDETVELLFREVMLEKISANVAFGRMPPAKSLSPRHRTLSEALQVYVGKASHAPQGLEERGDPVLGAAFALACREGPSLRSAERTESLGPGDPAYVALAAYVARCRGDSASPYERRLSLVRERSLSPNPKPLRAPTSAFRSGGVYGTHSGPAAFHSSAVLPSANSGIFWATAGSKSPDATRSSTTSFPKG